MDRSCWVGMHYNFANPRGQGPPSSRLTPRPTFLHGCFRCGNVIRDRGIIEQSSSDPAFLEGHCRYLRLLSDHSKDSVRILEASLIIG